MRKLLILSVLLIIFAFVGTVPAFASTHPACQWVQVDTDNDLATPPVSLYGYWVDLNGTQTLIVCDPQTDEPVKDADGKGIAYLNNGQYVETETDVLDKYETKQVLDWDNPKQVKPLEVSLSMPNVPTSTAYDRDYYNQTGELRRKTQNQFGWPMSYAFAQLIPGSNPDNWLIIASVRNPNSFAVSGSLSAYIQGWTSGWSSSPVSKDTTVSLGPNETKYVLLNRGKPVSYMNYFTDEWGTWSGASSWRPGYSTAMYSTSIAGITDPEYPQQELSGGYYKPYVRWDGTDPTVYPLIPMRLAFTFWCWSYDPYKSSNYYMYYGGREWPECFGRAEYDPEKDDWSVSVDFRGSMEKPWYMSDADWQRIVDRATGNAVTALKKLFRTWYPKVPFWCAWNRDQMHVNGDTGQVYGNRWPNPAPFTVTFGYLEPVPPSSAPPPPGCSQYWWSNSRWGGWWYTTSQPYSYGNELTAPTLLNYSEANQEKNWTAITYNGDVDAQIGRGTYIEKHSTDPRYYDPNGWMRYLPVFKAEPMFVEKYTFIATKGDCGVLKKDVVPGYLLRVSTQPRPTLTYSTQPVEITASWTCWGSLPGSVVDITRTWRWTPKSGWTFAGQSPSAVTPPSQAYDFSARNGSGMRWTASVRFSQTVTGSNPADFPVSWANMWGSGVSLFAPAVSLPEPVRLAAGETKFVWSSEGGGSVELSADWRRGETIGDFESRVLAQIFAEAQKRFFSGQGEAVFGSGVKFTMTQTFETGKGGIVCGSQKYLIHRNYVWKSKWDDYGWDNYLNYTTIGFKRGTYDVNYPTNLGLYSYFNSSSPTGGQIVAGNDEILGTLLNASDQARTISLNSWEATTGNQYWRYYYNGNVYPPDYP